MTLESASTGTRWLQKSSSSLRGLGQAGSKQLLWTVIKHLKQLSKHHDPYKLKNGDHGPPRLPQCGTIQWFRCFFLKTHDPNLTPSWDINIFLISPEIIKKQHHQNRVVTKCLTHSIYFINICQINIEQMNLWTNSANDHTWSYLALVMLWRTKSCNPKQEKFPLLKVI